MNHFRKQYSEDQLPIHPCLNRVSSSEQVLSNYTSRLLLTYEKIKEPEVKKLRLRTICIKNIFILTKISTIKQPQDASCTIGEANFRDQYFNMREELRSVRRARLSAERLRMKQEWELRKSNSEKT